MLANEILPLLDDVRAIVDVSPESTDPAHHLRIPEHVPHTRCGLSEAAGLDLDAGTVLLCLLGDGEAGTDPHDLAPVLARLAPRARALLLLAWPIEELPYHRLIGPLVDARCQARYALPLHRVARHGVPCALVVDRVDRIAPPHRYLDLPQLGERPESAGEADTELRTMLRLANEHVLADVVARPLRRRLREQEAELAELRRVVAEQAAELAEARARAHS